tara:strand:- start:134 stop:775 length:642 start_codon:yes stop_codon:yes gene_type:complete
MTANVVITQEDLDAINGINARVIGWSNPNHYAFFKAMLGYQPIRKMLVLGVYRGRDICYLLDILNRYHPGRMIEIVGVDRFSDEACADWTPAKERRTWQEEVDAPPPNLDVATENTRDARVRLIKTDDFAFLDATAERFDFVYLDTAHDYNTVSRQLRQVGRVCDRDAIVCGDDYSDHLTWGVKSAVREAFGADGHQVFAEWIWYGNLSHIKK